MFAKRKSKDMQLINIQNYFKEIMMEKVKEKIVTELPSKNVPPKRTKIKKYNWRTELPFLLMLLPAIILVVLIHYFPYFGLIGAFKGDYKTTIGQSGIEALLGAPWVGFDHFKAIFTTPNVGKAIWNTIYINLLSLLFEFPTPIILAILISEVSFKPFKKTVQTLSYLPHFLSIAAVTGIVSSLIGQYGVISNICSLLGIEYEPLASKSAAFIPVYIITNVWKTIGWNSILYLAAIVGINKDLYEAASIDGANRFQQIMHILLPGIMPMIMMMLIMRSGNLLASNFELVYGLEMSTEWKKFDVISTWVYRNGLETKSAQGLSMALGLVQGILSFGLISGVNAISKKVADVSMW